MTDVISPAANQGRTLPAWQARALAALPALRSRNFRLFWTGQIISTIGTSLQVVAEGYLVYELTQSTFWLGMVGLLGLLPVLPISLLGGVLIDRVPRRKLIMATQVGLMLQAAVFGALAVSGALQLWHIIALYFVFGALLAIDHPARRAFLVELVDEDELANAVALNATVFNLSSLIGYALAGLIIAPRWAQDHAANALTYVAPHRAGPHPWPTGAGRFHDGRSQAFVRASPQRRR
ncbi:MAG: MFS transporter [Caldilineaceae bacterium]